MTAEYGHLGAEEQAEKCHKSPYKFVLADCRLITDPAEMEQLCNSFGVIESARDVF